MIQPQTATISAVVNVKKFGIHLLFSAEPKDSHCDAM